MRVVAAIIAVSAGLVAPAARAGEGGAAKLLCGFERRELESWAAKGKRAGWRVEDAKEGGGFEFVRGNSGRVPLLAAAKGDATEGQFALIHRVGAKADFPASWGKLYMKPHVTEPPRRDAQQQRSGSLLRTAHFGSLARILPADWSGYGWLLLDAKSTAADAELAVLLEDEVVEPPLDRTYRLPAGKWVTLAFDLAGAAKTGGLDPARMSNVEVMIDRAAGKTDLLLDNIRLAGGIEGARLPVLKDESPWRKPFTDAVPGKPEPVAVGARPVREPVKLAEPTLIDTSKTGKSYTRFSQCLHSLSAFDNRFMVLDGALASTSSVLSSTDGGATWKGLDGGVRATVLAEGHQNTRNLWVDDGGGLIGIFILFCAGGPNRSDIYFRRLRFTGQGWETSPFSLVDVDVRHCPERFALLRLGSGQVWAAWDHLCRDGGTRLRLRVSDDDGKSWRRPEGAEALPEQRVPLGGGPALVPYGEKGVACLWKSSKDSHVWWSRSEDLATWTAPQLAAQKAGINAAVTVGAKEVFFSTEPGGRMALRFLPPGGAKLLRWDGAAWKAEAGPWAGAKAEKVSSPNLSVMGGELVAGWVEEAGGRRAVMLAKRRADGGWTKPFRAAEESEALENLVMPRSSPPNFVPLAWSPASGRWVKTLRVPAEELAK